MNEQYEHTKGQKIKKKWFCEKNGDDPFSKSPIHLQICILTFFYHTEFLLIFTRYFNANGSLTFTACPRLRFSSFYG